MLERDPENGTALGNDEVVFRNREWNPRASRAFACAFEKELAWMVREERPPPRLVDQRCARLALGAPPDWLPSPVASSMERRRRLLEATARAAFHAELPHAS
jgi:hypothetical protein